MFLRVEFIDNEEGGFVVFAEFGGDGLVFWGEAGLHIDGEEDEGGGFESEVDLFFCCLVNFCGGHFGGFHADAAGIHEDKVVIDFFYHDVAGDAWLVVNDGQAFAYQSVK